MSLITLNNTALAEMTGHDSIPEIFVTIAKMSVMLGASTDDIASQMGVDVESVREVELTQKYRDIRLVLSVEHSKEKVDRDMSYDTLESKALAKLVKQVDYEKDTDVLLRIASMANRAERRVAKNNDIIPQTGNPKVPLRLSERIVRKINSDGSAEETRERSVSVLNGQAKNPSFERVENLFSQGSAVGVEHSQSEHPDYADSRADPRTESGTTSTQLEGLAKIMTRPAGSATPGNPSNLPPPSHTNSDLNPRQKLAMLAEKALRNAGIGDTQEQES